LLILLGFTLGHFHGRLHSLSLHKEEQQAISSVAASTISSSIEEVDDGWTTIQVYSRFNASRPNDEIWHSQARQDELVLALLRNKTGGYFVDLAANDAVSLSNTYSLERYWGWKGVCIEPNPIYWHNLSAYRSCTKIAAVVGSKSMEGPLYDEPTGMATHP
jgi:hypothetical protein